MQRVTDGLLKSAAFLVALLLFVLGMRKASAFLIVLGLGQDWALGQIVAQQGGIAPWNASATKHSPAEWLHFKAFWKELERETKVPQNNLEMKLAESFDMPESAFRKALWQAEYAAVGAKTSTGYKPLNPTRYALACLAQLLIDAKTPQELFYSTRMAMPPTRSSEFLQLGLMARLDKQVAGLIPLKRQGLLNINTLQVALERPLIDVYRFRALRIAAEVHRHFHPATAPMVSPEPTSDLKGRNFLQEFLNDPTSTVVGSEVWIQEFDRAVQEIIKDLQLSNDSKDRSAAQTIRKQQAILALALKRLEAARPGLETLFADLEESAGS